MFSFVGKIVSIVIDIVNKIEFSLVKQEVTCEHLLGIEGLWMVSIDYAGKNQAQTFDCIDSYLIKEVGC